MKIAGRVSGVDEAVAPPAAYAAQLGQVAAMATGSDHALATFAEAFAVQELVEALLDPSNHSQGRN
mgnify:CR=1 FL=1